MWLYLCRSYYRNIGITDNSFKSTFIKLKKNINEEINFNKGKQKNDVIQYLLMNDEKKTGKVM